MPDALKLYKTKRNFSITSEPEQGGEASQGALTFVIQKHWATRLHYDFRLELDGTMKSWAVPKGPSYDTHDRRMAIHVEDHPISYSDFEGTIPPKQYGAGKVIIWDKGTWSPIGDPRQGFAKGEIKFEIHGHKMHGRWVLVRLRGHADDKQEPWLLIKENDEYARPDGDFSVVDAFPDSVKDLPMPDAPAAEAKVEALKAGRDGADAAPARRKTAATKTAPTKTAATKTAATKTAASKAAPARRGAMPAGALKAALPEKLTPELATLVDGPPLDPDAWIYEIKFDGYRMLTRIEGKDIRLITRNGNDWTAKLLPLQQEIRRMKLPDGWYDGEIVVHDENGKPNFNLLQLAFDGSNRTQVVYFVFDAPYLKGYDLREVRLDERRPLLQALLTAKPSDTVRFSAEFGTDPSELVVAACQIGLEGVIGKRRDSRYVTRRSPEWIKLKCGQRQEFVIGGFTDPQGSRTGIGSLLLGYYDADGVLRYAGHVGSGFNGASLRHLREVLEKIETKANPFPARAVPGKGKHWVKPELVAEVSFSEWTPADVIRHPVFQGLRKDKPAHGVVRETAKHAQEVSAVKEDEAKPARKRAARTVKKPGESLPGNLPATFKVTHGERVMDAQSGVTKIELVRYYALVSELMMEHLEGRPVSLVRAPEGVGGELFFQKHVTDPAKMPGVMQMDQKLDPEHPRMTRIGSAEGLLSSAQWNVVEIHSQNATAGHYDTPDRFVFDLDPGEGVSWAQVQEAAALMRAFLLELGLKPFLKTSGGKGLHVVVPIKPKLDWDTVKDFSHAVVDHLAKTLPDRFSNKSGAKNRVGRIFIDYLRNGRGATTVSAWSARARPGLGISVPVRWEELPELTSGAHWTVSSVQERLAVGNAPWADYARSATTLAKAMKVLGFKRAEQRA